MYLQNTELSAISRLFSSGVIQQMARKGKSPLFTSLIKETNLLNNFHEFDSVSNLFESAFAILQKKCNRHEYVYKAALAHRILLGTHSLQTASMLTEFRVGDCKADLVILNGTATVYEIKSERDSLSRLERQINAYKRVFGRVYVIAGENHIDSVLSLVSDDIGVMQLSAQQHISTLRKALDCPERTSPEAILGSIRLSEAKLILKELGLSIPQVPNTELYSTLQSLFAKQDPHAVHTSMVNILKKARTLAPLSTLVQKLPTSLQAAALSIPIKKQDHERLLSAVNTRVLDAMKWT